MPIIYDEIIQEILRINDEHFKRMLPDYSPRVSPIATSSLTTSSFSSPVSPRRAIKDYRPNLISPKCSDGAVGYSPRVLPMVTSPLASPLHSPVSPRRSIHADVDTSVSAWTGKQLFSALLTKQGHRPPAKVVAEQKKFRDFVSEIEKTLEEFLAEQEDSCIVESQKIKLLFRIFYGHVKNSMEEGTVEPEILDWWSDICRLLEDKLSGVKNEKEFHSLDLQIENICRALNKLSPEAYDFNSVQLPQELVNYPARDVPINSRFKIFDGSNFLTPIPDASLLESEHEIFSLGLVPFSQIILAMRNGQYQTNVKQFSSCMKGFEGLKAKDINTPQKNLDHKDVYWRKPDAQLAAKNIAIQLFFEKIKKTFQKSCQLTDDHVFKIACILLSKDKNPFLESFQILVTAMNQCGIYPIEYTTLGNKPGFIKIDVENPLKLKLQFVVVFTRVYTIKCGIIDKSDDPPLILKMSCEIKLNDLSIIDKKSSMEAIDVLLPEIRSLKDYAAKNIHPIMKRASEKTSWNQAIDYFNLYPIVLPLHENLWRKYFDADLALQKLEAIAKSNLFRKGKDNTILMETDEQAARDLPRRLAINGKSLFTLSRHMEITIGAGGEIASADVCALIKKYLAPSWTEDHQLALNLLVDQGLFCPTESVWYTLYHILMKRGLMLTSNAGVSVIEPNGSPSAKYYNLTLAPDGQFSLLGVYKIFSIHDGTDALMTDESQEPFLTYSMEIELPATKEQSFKILKEPTITLYANLKRHSCMTELLKSLHYLNKCDINQITQLESEAKSTGQLMDLYLKSFEKNV